MDKPKKKILGIINDDKEILALENFKDGYNKACNDWEKFLPDKYEIAGIINDVADDFEKIKDTLGNVKLKDIISRLHFMMAETIAKRIGKERNND